MYCRKLWVSKVKVVGGNGSWRFLPLLMGASLLAKLVKNLSANKGDTGDYAFNPWVGKIPLEEEMATQSSILA